jgi:CO/xanthine dehydrogenase Mo-binding subunit
VRAHLASSFDVAEENVSVVSPFVGGAFGSSLRPNYYPALTAMAARELKRPVKIVYTRRQMYTGHGYRPYTIQKIALDADRSGKLTSMIHEAVHNTSSFEEFNEARPISPARSTPVRISTRRPHHEYRSQCADVDARAGRGERHVRPRMLDGRAGVRAED